ncbi:OadG-related small transporter subunit [Oscillospiraceae bacterium LTW-04]|nr:OadG-related small transporter subunit [Oscillospiraceae bacterium MB24-C1]
MNVQALIDVLPLAGQGMAGVFLVIVLIWLSIVALTKFFK